MKIVATAFGLDQHNSTGCPAELGAEVIRQHLKLFNRTDIHALAVLVFRVVVIRDAVGLKGRGARACAIKGGGTAARQREVVLTAGGVCLKSGNDAEQLPEITADDRNGPDKFLTYRAADLSTRGIDDRSDIRDSNRLLSTRHGDI